MNLDGFSVRTSTGGFLSVLDHVGIRLSTYDAYLSAFPPYPRARPHIHLIILVIVSCILSALPFVAEFLASVTCSVLRSSCRRVVTSRTLLLQLCAAHKRGHLFFSRIIFLRNAQTSSRLCPLFSLRAYLEIVRLHRSFIL